MYRYLALLLAVGMIHGCTTTNEPNGGGNGGDGPNVERTAPPGLKAFQSESELQGFLVDQVTTRSVGMRGLMGGGAVFENDAVAAGPAADFAGGGFTPPPGAPSPVPAAAAEAGDGDQSSTGFSGTTTQETGVDEADVVKTDGQRLYVINGETLKIVDVSSGGAPALLSETRIEGYGREIYLMGDTVVALTETFGGYQYFGGGGIAIDIGLPFEGADAALDNGEVRPPAQPSGDNEPAPLPPSDIALPTEPTIDPIFAPFPVYERPRTNVVIYDVSDPSAPRMVAQYKIDGWQASSRAIDGVLRLVVANYQDYYFDVMPMMGRGEFDPSTIDAARMMPKYEYADAAGTTGGDLVTWKDLYRPDDADGFGIVSVVTIDTADPSKMSAVGIVAEPGLIYSSTEALYLTNTNYDFTGQARESTNLYKLAYVDGGAVPTATGNVSGRVLNQYSMGEHNGYLRVATTIGPIWRGEGDTVESTNSVYVLDEVDGVLHVAGKLENIAVGESIQSARFLGDRGYLVTFLQVDPLFTLDLADPTAPRVVGELKVPGFSTHIIPMDGNHLLTVGQFVPEDGSRPWGGGVQLSIFDVTDFANPVLKYNTVINEGDEVYSEALWNPKAFTYFAEQGLVAVPVSIYEYQDAWGGDGEWVEPATDLIDVIASGETPTEEQIDQAVDELVDAWVNDTPSSDDVTVDVDVPINSIDDDGFFAPEPWVPQGFDGLVVYRVSADAGIAELGRISTRFEDQGYYGVGFTRGVFVGDKVYAVTDTGVRGAAVSNVNTEQVELFYGPIYDIFPVESGDVVTIDEPELTVDGSGVSGGTAPSMGGMIR